MVGNKIHESITKLQLIFRNIGILSLVLLVILLFIESIMRKLFHVSFITSNEIGGIGMYLFVVLSLGWLYKIDGYIRSDFLVVYLPTKLREMFEIFLHFLTFVFASYVTYLWAKYLVVQTIENYRYYPMSRILEWPFHMIGMVSWAILALTAVERVVIEVLKLLKKNGINERVEK